MASPAGPTSQVKSKLQMELFSLAKEHCIAPYRQVFCQHDKDTVVLFRACCEHLGPHAAQTKTFRGSPCYDKDWTRMMWFDTSFLVAMRKAAWGAKQGREVVLAIWVKRSFLQECLEKAVCSDTLGSSSKGGGGRSGRKGRSSFAASTFPPSGGAGGDDGRDSPSSRCSSPVNSMAGSPPSSPIGRHLQRRDQSAPGGEGRTANGSDAGDDDRAGRGAAAAAAQLAKGGASLMREVPEDDDDQDDGEEPRGRALTGDPSMGYSFGRSKVQSPGDGGEGGGRGGRGGFDRGAEEGERAPGRRPRSRRLTPPYCHGRVAEVVRLHWEPERLPSGEKHRTRRVVQLGLKGKWLEMLASGDSVVRIERLDGLLAEQRMALASSEPHLLRVPVARPFDVGYLPDAQLAALHLVSERARPKLRILCLHGYLQNRQIFSARTRQLYRRLKNTAELVYVDAPHLLSSEELPPPLPARSPSPLETAATEFTAAAAAAAAKVVNTGEGGALESCEELLTPLSSPMHSPPHSPRVGPSYGCKTLCDRDGGDHGSGIASKQQQQPDRAGARTWWRCDAEERTRAKAVPGMAGRCEWKGLADSLAFLRNVWDEQGPFDGLLGFSQGAAMASIFNHFAFSGREISGDLAGFEMPLLPPPRFGVFISGSYQPHPTQIPSYPRTQDQAQEKLPSLHVWAIEDRFVPASQSQWLAGMYLRPAVFMHRGQHCVPQTKETLTNFVRFLEERR